MNKIQKQNLKQPHKKRKIKFQIIYKNIGIYLYKTERKTDEASN